MAKCPISCGDCCDEWAYVEVLWPHEGFHLNRDDPCPNLGADGCTLSRSKRPRVCLNHLCSRALHILKPKSTCDRGGQTFWSLEDYNRRPWIEGNQANCAGEYWIEWGTLNALICCVECWNDIRLLRRFRGMIFPEKHLTRSVWKPYFDNNPPRDFDPWGAVVFFWIIPLGLSQGLPWAMLVAFFC